MARRDPGHSYYRNLDTGYQRRAAWGEPGPGYRSAPHRSTGFSFTQQSHIAREGR